MSYIIYNENCLDAMKRLEDNSVDSIVTDPPYGLSQHTPDQVLECLKAWLAGEVYVPKGKGFMGKSWDAWVPGPEIWREALRVLKPGGHVLAFAGTRSMDLMSMAIRLAGFELRDSIGYAHDGGGAPLMAWTFGSGFPKSHDVSKAIDKQAGAEREVVGSKVTGNAKQSTSATGEFADGKHGGQQVVDVTAPATEAAQQWQGWGTALKPAWEPIILARKPLVGTVAANVLEHGTGALNIDGCRVATDPSVDDPRLGGKGAWTTTKQQDGDTVSLPRGTVGSSPLGRWPANLILSIPEDEYALRDDVTPSQLRQLAEWLDANP